MSEHKIPLVEPLPREDWLTPSQAAAAIGVSARTLAYYKAAGRIAHERVGGRVYYTPAALVAFARSEVEHVDAAPAREQVQ